MSFFLCTIAVSAQIQRKILDFSLGVTTKTQVLNYLKSHHYKYSHNEDGEYVVEKIKFAGHIWPVAYFSFYKGKFYCVDFRDSDSFTPKETLELVWNSINQSLCRKYSAYSNTIDNDYIDFSDNRTSVSLDHRYLMGGRTLAIMYIDLINNRQKIKEDEDEL